MLQSFWLWDAGFQLSYAAVLSLLIFMNPVYQLFTIKNKWLDLLWKMNAVTLSAQILTIPFVSIIFISSQCVLTSQT
ncbi:MAG: ComEC/Rec2 family competence protein [Chitinophagaceae bacterium]|nr:ComEC/Rec2 family competence protein [Chitinophagaceae bacterium]